MQYVILVVCIVGTIYLWSQGLISNDAAWVASMIIAPQLASIKFK